MLKDLSDEEAKELIRNLARLAGFDLSEDRISVILPQFKIQLRWIDTLDAFKLELETEPAPIFQLRKRPSQ